MGEIAALVDRLGQSIGDMETFGHLRQTCVRLAPNVTSVSLALVGGNDSLHYFGLGSSPGEPHRLVGTLPLQRTAAGAAIAAKRTLCSDDPAVSGAKLEDWRGLPAACQSAISAPMLSNGVAIGCLNVASSRPHAFSGLQQTFSTLAAVIAPHLRLARSEKALQATQSLLRDALMLEQANASAAQQQQQRPRERVQQTGAAAADAAVAAPATPRAAHGAALRAQSIASTAADSFDAQLSAGAPASATAAGTTAESATAHPLVVRVVVAAASTAAGWLRALVANSVRPSASNSTSVRASEPGASTSKAGKSKFAGRRHRGEGYAFDDYEFSSDDESAEPSRAAGVPAVAAPLGRWRGPLEFWDAATEGAYLDWACATWQAPLDIAVGSAALGHIMMLAASPNTDCIGCGLLDGGALLAVCRVLLAMLLLFGVRLMLMRRSHYLRHREWLISCVRMLCVIMAAARLAPPAQAQQELAARLLRDLMAPTLVVLPVAAQVRFSRHLLLTAVQVAVTAAAVAASADISWRNAISHPAELGYAIGSVLLPAAGLYLTEAAARRNFVRSHMPLHAE